jgi:UDP-N-acetylglucosamine 2-epimerase (non-hydrolysing)
MNKILIVFGTRPEAIKLAPVITKLKVESQNLQVRVCVTAQHREMLDQVLDFFEIEPDYDLNIMRYNQSLSEVTINGLRKLEPILKKEKPDIILVQGDTTTTFVASLAAYYLNIKIAHIEAGLRTKDKFNPFPEEMNRRLTDCLADLYFAPTKNAKNNLIKEGIDENKIFITGNTVIDALLMTIEKQNDLNRQKNIKQEFIDNYGISFNNQRLILVTGHRRESFGKDFENISYGLKKIAANNQNIQIIYPVHLNPNVQKPVKKILAGISNIHLMKPLDYFSFVWLLNQAYLILTDSGGIQEEAPSLGKPVLVMRKTTERPEGIEAGTAKLVGIDSEKIYSEATKLLDDEKLYQSMAKAVNPYGDGKASDRICEVLNSYL